MKAWASKESLVEKTQLRKLLDQHHQQPAISSEPLTLVCLLQACGALSSLPDGHCIHGHLALFGLERNLVIANYLITMYGNCFSVAEARDTFIRIEPHNLVSWTAMITVFTRHDQSSDALSLFYQMQAHGIKPSKVTFVSLLSACASNEAFSDGRIAHAYLTELGFESDLVVNNALITMYDRCASVTEARNVFDHMVYRDVVAWTAMIGAYNQHGQFEEALQVFHNMLLSIVKPNAVTFVNILSACASSAATKEGMTLHFLVIESGFEQNIVVANALLILYGNAGCVEDAMQTFNGINNPNASNWTTIIAVSTQHRKNHTSWNLFDLMQRKGMEVNKVTLITVLNACTCAQALVKGEAFHMCIINRGYESDVTMGNALIGMYSRCGNFNHAEATFLQMPSRDVVTFTSIIVAYIQYGFCEDGAKEFQSMIEKGMRPDKVAFISILAACVEPEALDFGQIIHAKVLEYLSELDAVLSNSLLTMYGKCGSVASAANVFQRIRNKTRVTWNAMISFHAQNGNVDEAFQLFQQMYTDGVKRDVASFVSVLSTCTGESTLGIGRLVHGLVVDSELELDGVLGNTLVNMYGKSGRLADAKWVFDSLCKSDVIAWASIIAAYAQHGDSITVANLYYQMQSKAVKPDKFIYSLVVAACTGPEMLQDGRNVHLSILQSNIEIDLVLENALINMYGKCGSVNSAQQVFNKMRERDLFSFNAMIGAHAQLFHGNEAFQTFQQMQVEGIEPDRVSYLGVLSACCSLVDLNVGKVIHALASNGWLKHDDAVTNALINMYSKCGVARHAWKMFKRFPERGIITWNTMITALADHAHTRRALEVFDLMVDEGIEPNEISFVSVLSACSRAGLVDQGLRIFQRINGANKATLRVSHFGCMVDLLTRVGRLGEAEAFLSLSPYQPSVVEWMTLLSTSKTFDDVQQGKRAAEYLMELDEECTAPYVVLGNAYAVSNASFGQA